VANPIESNLKIKRLAQLTEVIEKHIDKGASKEIETTRSPPDLTHSKPFGAALEDRRRKNNELEQDGVLFKSYIAKQRAINEEDDEGVGRKRKADELEDPDVQEKRQQQ